MTTAVEANGKVTGHPIKVVAQRTGLSAHVIRIWEKRYNAVVPERTDTNRRLYSNADIERLQLLKRAIQAGRSIGQIANLPIDELRNLVTQDEVSLSPPERIRTEGNEEFLTYLEAAVEAAQKLDAQALQSVLTQAGVSLTQPALIEKVIVPLMYQIGDLWRDGELRIAHEHLAYAVIRTFLESLKTTYVVSETAPQVVVATPSGQLHELGALIVSAIASAEGWQVTYLGTALPAEEIAAAAIQRNVRAVALSVVYPGDDPHLNTELIKLRSSLPKDMDILIGGRSVAQYRTIIQAINGIEINNIDDLRNRLHELRST